MQEHVRLLEDDVPVRVVFEQRGGVLLAEYNFRPSRSYVLEVDTTQIRAGEVAVVLPAAQQSSRRPRKPDDERAHTASSFWTFSDEGKWVPAAAETNSILDRAKRIP